MALNPFGCIESECDKPRPNRDAERFARFKLNFNHYQECRQSLQANLGLWY